MRDSAGHVCKLQNPSGLMHSNIIDETTVVMYEIRKTAQPRIKARRNRKSLLRQLKRQALLASFVPYNLSAAKICLEPTLGLATLPIPSSSTSTRLSMSHHIILGFRHLRTGCHYRGILSLGVQFLTPRGQPGNVA